MSEESTIASPDCRAPWGDRRVSYELIVEHLHIIVIQFSSWQLKAIGSLLHFLTGEVGAEKARD